MAAPTPASTHRTERDQAQRDKQHDLMGEVHPERDETHGHGASHGWLGSEPVDRWKQCEGNTRPRILATSPQ